MVFGIFTRKPPTSPEQPNANPVSRLPTPTPSTVSIPASARQSPLRFPTSLRAVLTGSTGELAVGGSDAGTFDGAESPAAQPPVTPSPPPPPAAGDSKALYDLMLTIPPKTLHAYTLTHLSPEPSSSKLYNAPSPISPPSPETVTKLHHFFATLAPPPLLHCVRCHADFYDIENEEKDKACHVPHDDESALVSRVSGGGYETLWGCCGRTAEGNGGEGPPDGWCYEGRHTTDIKRARFRADSTIHNDKLTSCLKLNCRGIRDTLPRAAEQHHGSSTRKSDVSPTRSQGVASVTRKRPRKSINKDTLSASGDEQDHASSRGRAQKDKSHENTDESCMIIDRPPPKVKARPVSRVLRPRTRSLVREQSRPRRSAREASRSSPLRKANQGSEGNGTDNDREEEGKRGRKKRRTGV
ncbi:hypothetical protein EDC04DRAFT_3108160 [Pisolithus marmoratus]|nr:hypothetical protein EDC04DRAFT_3108160 [Pisolithus marmoratus]